MPSSTPVSTAAKLSSGYVIGGLNDRVACSIRICSSSSICRNVGNAWYIGPCACGQSAVGLNRVTISGQEPSPLSTVSWTRQCPNNTTACQHSSDLSSQSRQKPQMTWVRSDGELLERSLSSGSILAQISSPTSSRT